MNRSPRKVFLGEVAINYLAIVLIFIGLPLGALHSSRITTLKYGRSGTYGLIIPDITNPFFPEFIESFVVANDHEMLMATIDFQSGRMQQTIRRMLVRKVDGVALVASEIET